ncbi:MAG: DNA-binding response regulator [Bacteroidia bacterium]|nr:DNA-binding response regulator [Bacteroidia bacterium]
MGKRIAIIIGGVLGLVLVSLKALEVTYFSARIPLEIYLGGVAVLFLAGGLAAGMIWMKRRQEAEQISQKEEKGEINLIAGETDLSERELDVLKLIAEGMSNQEISDKLFVSLNTVKTHTSNIYQKLDVKRRTQAVQKAKELGVLP